MNLIHKLEPLLWMIFGAGGYVAAAFLPGLLIGVCILGGLGAFETGLAYERIHGLASSGLGKTLVGVVLILTFWHSAHHMRHMILDLAGVSAASVGAYLSYLLAIVASLLTIGALGAL